MTAEVTGILVIALGPLWRYAEGVFKAVRYGKGF
jgi:hypothetical protein